MIRNVNRGIPKARGATPKWRVRQQALADWLNRANDRACARVVELMRRGNPMAVRQALRLRSSDEDALWLLYDIMTNDETIPRVKRCRWCERWFVARRVANDHFCGNACHDEWHRKSPEMKERYNKRMREYMQRKRKGEQHGKTKKASVRHGRVRKVS